MDNEFNTIYLLALALAHSNWWTLCELHPWSIIFFHFRSKYAIQCWHLSWMPQRYWMYSCAPWSGQTETPLGTSQGKTPSPLLDNYFSSFLVMLTHLFNPISWGLWRHNWGKWRGTGAQWFVMSGLSTKYRLKYTGTMDCSCALLWDVHLRGEVPFLIFHFWALLNTRICVAYGDSCRGTMILLIAFSMDKLLFVNPAHFILKYIYDPRDNH